MTDNIIDYIVTGEHSKANGIFDKMLQDKIDTAMEQEKIAVANSMFNDGEDEEVDVEEEQTLEQEVDLSDELDGIEPETEGEEEEAPEAEAEGDDVEQE